MTQKLVVESINEKESDNIIEISQNIILSGKALTDNFDQKRKVNFEFYIDLNSMMLIGKHEDALQEFYDTLCSSMVELTNMGLKKSMLEPSKKITILRESEITSYLQFNHIKFSMNSIDKTIIE